MATKTRHPPARKPPRPPANGGPALPPLPALEDAPPARPHVPGGWRRAAELWGGDLGIQEIFAEALRIREAERPGEWRRNLGTLAADPTAQEVFDEVLRQIEAERRLT